MVQLNSFAPPAGENTIIGRSRGAVAISSRASREPARLMFRVPRSPGVSIGAPKGLSAATLCLDLAKSARFTVPVPSTTGFNCRLLAPSTICGCPNPVKGTILAPKALDSGESRLQRATANKGGNLWKI
jgi:hypothetical protein